MDHSAHADHGRASDPHAGHKMSDLHGAHDRHARHSVAMFRDKFWLSFALTIPVVFWSADVQHWLGYTAPSFPGSSFIPAVLGTVVFVYGGMVFLRGAAGELADRTPGMMTLISLAIIVAFVTSLAATFGIFEIDVWWELASLITIMVLGHWLEMRAISQARGALNALAALLPDTAERVEGADTRVRAALRIACRRRRARAAWSPCSGGRHRCRGGCRRRRVHDHGRVKRRAEAGRCRCAWRDGRRRRKPSRPCHGNGGPVRAVRNHAARRRCAGLRLSHASSR
jgi:hypothetical protein